MDFAHFYFKNVFVEFNGEGYIVSGSGVADVNVDGDYHFEKGTMTYDNGDPGYPDSEDYEIYDVEINSISDFEVDEVDGASKKLCRKAHCNVPSEDTLDNFFEQNKNKLEYFYGEVEEVLENNLTKEDFDQDDLYEVLINNLDSYEDSYY